MSTSLKPDYMYRKHVV